MVTALLSGQGSGVVVSPAGHIVTNRHVVESEDGSNPPLFVTVRDAGGTPHLFYARLVAAHPTRDLALIQVHGLEDVATLKRASWNALLPGTLEAPAGYTFTPAIFASPHNLQPGDRVVAIGNPTEGNPSQTAIPQPPSGGPMANAAGQVLGINTLAGPIEPASVQTWGAAIPADEVLAFVREHVPAVPVEVQLQVPPQMRSKTRPYHFFGPSHREMARLVGSG